MREIETKRIAITGGAGFLGSHLCERLLSQGHEVLCIDNYFTGSGIPETLESLQILSDQNLRLFLSHFRQMTPDRDSQI